MTPDTELELQPEHQLSVSTLLELELDSGERVVLLDDRGWTAGTGRGRSIWGSLTPEVVEESARDVVGPDDPVHGETWEETVVSYWKHLAETAERAGVAASGPDLAALPHDVVLALELLARLSSPPVT